LPRRCVLVAALPFEYVYGARRRLEPVANALILDEARRIASNIAKLP
jgi:hypothetical protein